MSQHRHWAQQIPQTRGPVYLRPSGDLLQRQQVPRAPDLGGCSGDAHHGGRPPDPEDSVPESLCPRGVENLSKGTKMALLRVSPREKLWVGRRHHCQSVRGFLISAPSDPKDQCADHVGRQCCRGAQGSSKAHEHQTRVGTFSKAGCFVHPKEGRGVRLKESTWTLLSILSSR